MQCLHEPPDMGVPVRGHVTSAYLGGPPNGYYDYWLHNIYIINHLSDWYRLSCFSSPSPRWSSSMGWWMRGSASKSAWSSTGRWCQRVKYKQHQSQGFSLQQSLINKRWQEELMNQRRDGGYLSDRKMEKEPLSSGHDQSTKVKMFSLHQFYHESIIFKLSNICKGYV